MNLEDYIWWPMAWWMELVFDPVCDWLDNSLLNLGFIALTLPFTLAVILCTVLWWFVLLMFAVLTFPFLLLWRITHGR